jgi:hypothetical protein
MFCWLAVTDQAASNERLTKHNPASGPDGAEQRMAQLVGNADYTEKDRLGNPVNDVDNFGPVATC